MQKKFYAPNVKLKRSHGLPKPVAFGKMVWLYTMAKHPSFDYTAAIATVCSDMCFRIPELQHIDMNRVAVGFSQTKNSEPFGIFASTTPLRFENGELFHQRRDRYWTLQRHFRPDGVEYLYILYFYVPRFIELPLSQKLDTIVHELYHVNPLFNGDLRRFAGRRFAHGSKNRYDQIVNRLVQSWLKNNPPNDLWEFLCYNYRDLTAKYGKVSGTRIPFPKVIPVNATEQTSMSFRPLAEPQS